MGWEEEKIITLRLKSILKAFLNAKLSKFKAKKRSPPENTLSLFEKFLRRFDSLSSSPKTFIRSGIVDYSTGASRARWTDGYYWLSVRDILYFEFRQILPERFISVGHGTVVR